MRKNRNDTGLAHSSLSRPSYLPLWPWEHHISSLMNSPIKKKKKKKRDFDFSRIAPAPAFRFSYLSNTLSFPAPRRDIAVYHLLCCDLQIPFTLRILLDKEPSKVIGFPHLASHTLSYLPYRVRLKTVIITHSNGTGITQFCPVAFHAKLCSVEKISV